MVVVMAGHIPAVRLTTVVAVVAGLPTLGGAAQH